MLAGHALSEYAQQGATAALICGSFATMPSTSQQLQHLVWNAQQLRTPMWSTSMLLIVLLNVLITTC